MLEGPPDCGLLRESDMGPEEGPIKQRQTARQHAILPPQQGLTRFTQPAAHSSLSRPPTFCPTPVRRERYVTTGLRDTTNGCHTQTHGPTHAPRWVLGLFGLVTTAPSLSQILLGYAALSRMGQGAKGNNWSGFGAWAACWWVCEPVCTCAKLRRKREHRLFTSRSSTTSPPPG